jgi:hypothetical protein
MLQVSVQVSKSNYMVLAQMGIVPESCDKLHGLEASILGYQTAF